MPHRKQTVLPLIILVPGLVIVSAIYLLKPSPKADYNKLNDPAKTRVQVTRLNSGPAKLNAFSQGVVEPLREIDIVAQVGGQVVKVEPDFVAGGFFDKNAVLVHIDERDYTSAVVNAKAFVAEARQRLAEEKGRVRQARREWRDLGNQEANDLFLRKPQLKAAQANLDAALANLGQAELNLQRTKIQVPFNGRIRETYVDLGQFVSPGVPIAKVYDASVAEVRLPLNNRQASLIDLPLHAETELTPRVSPAVILHGNIGGNEHQWQGTVTRTEAGIDPTSRMYYAIAEIHDPFNLKSNTHPIPLVMGLFVEAEIEGKQLDNVIVLPREALFKRDKIYSLDKDNKVVLQTVHVLQTNAQKAWIRAGLTPNTPLVIDKLSLLTPGTEVEPISSSPSIAADELAPVAQQNN